jgi:ribonucleoside-diphosphate reductase alpha chain
MDYIFRWLQLRFLTGQQQMLFENLRPKLSAVSSQPSENEVDASEPKPEARSLKSGAGPIHAADALSSIVDLGDAPSCSFCGSIMTRNGSCYRCMSCGSTSGCS